uniref:heme attachment to plastid cytochrome c n=1 Tax=Trichomanes auriculatum TaxID=381226 RepID=UPI0028D59D79|nr:heme attachment to plastid cytochrome c [Vandenboschia auriculata]ALO81732.1 heme attachment to plastid cytochrome c [Vandenboschia auriculata]
MYTNINIEYTLTHISFLTLLFVTLFQWISLCYKIERLVRLSEKGMIIAFICITGSTMIRWIQSQHLPLSNLYESSMFLSWSFSLLHIILGVKNQNGWSGALTAPSALLTHGFATLCLSDEMQQSTKLVPALQSHWLMMHVSMMLLSYTTLLGGSLLAISSLVIIYDKGIDSSVGKRSHNLLPFISLKEIDKDSYKQEDNNLKRSFYWLSWNSQKCQLIHRFDQWSYQLISLGFPFLTIGILSGAVWANEAWGSYWSWDPKETWALVTWIIYAIYIHIKITKNWQGKGPAIVASTGFFLVRICFLGVNLSGIGLHNYGWLI